MVLHVSTYSLTCLQRATINSLSSSNAALYQALFYLPIYFQSIHSQSAIISGVNSIPFLAFFAVGALASGTVVKKTRLLQPYQLISALLMTAGMALLYTLEINSSKARYVGAEILLGSAVGFGNQIPMMAVQGLSKFEDVASSTGIMFSKYYLSSRRIQSYKGFPPTDSVSSGPIRQCRLFYRSGPVYLCQPLVADIGGHCPLP